MAVSHSMQGVSATLDRPEVRRISIADVFSALAAGVSDFRVKPSHYVFIGLMYPIAGMVLIGWSVGVELLPMVYPLMSGFALVGPIVALGLYEISRRIEAGEDASWRHAFDVRFSPAWPSIIAMSAYLMALFVCWLIVAQGLYIVVLGDYPVASLTRFVSDVMALPDGRALIFWGNLVGLFFALVALATSIVAFPLMLDRGAGPIVAIETSVRATFANPVPVLLWGLIVAAGLLVGFATLMVGLALIVPILGHATWHLYRRLVVAPGQVEAAIAPVRPGRAGRAKRQA